MKKYLILLFGFYLFNSCVDNKDILFSASDEIHLIFLYKNDSNFILYYNGVNSAEGTYTLSGDTVFLNYNLNVDGISSGNSNISRHANDILTRVLLIDKTSNKVKSLDDKNFCADISIDKRRK